MPSTGYLESPRYADGYRNGRADRLLRLPMLWVALMSLERDYAHGYKTGYVDAAFEIDRERRK